MEDKFNIEKDQFATDNGMIRVEISSIKDISDREYNKLIAKAIENLSFKIKQAKLPHNLNEDDGA